MTEAKQKVRKGALYNRRLLDSEVWQERNECVTKAALAFLEEHQVSCFHVFLPIERNKEIDTWSILRSSVDQGRQVVVSATDFDKQTMTHFQYTAELIFEEDRFGIPTPRTGSAADLDELELIFIPMLAGDKQGNRIGYGKGYYDRLLAEMSPDLLKVGLTLNSLFDRFSFAEPHDISLDYCITPHQVVKCK